MRQKNSLTWSGMWIGIRILYHGSMACALGTHASTMTASHAEAKVGFSFLKERFSTRVRRDPRANQIDVGLISGPFDRLRNRWIFEPNEGGSEVRFDIDFAFKSKMLDRLLQTNFELAVDRLMACFEDRARALYGQD